jgi:hypothetical protein
MPESDEIEKKLGGNITLIGFKLDSVELVVVKKIVGNYARKLAEKSGYKEIKLRLKQREHGKSLLNEIEAEAVVQRDKTEGSDIRLSAAAQDYNLFSALAIVMEKLLSEAEHKSKLNLNK